VNIAVLAACAALLAGLLWYSGDVISWTQLPAAGRATRLLTLVAVSMVGYVLLLGLAGLRKSHLEKGAT
jgi:hypothetical protein